MPAELPAYLMMGAAVYRGPSPTLFPGTPLLVRHSSTQACRNSHRSNVRQPKRPWWLGAGKLMDPSSAMPLPRRQGNLGRSTGHIHIYMYYHAHISLHVCASAYAYDDHMLLLSAWHNSVGNVKPGQGKHRLSWIPNPTLLYSRQALRPQFPNACSDATRPGRSTERPAPATSLYRTRAFEHRRDLGCSLPYGSPILLPPGCVRREILRAETQLLGHRDLVEGPADLVRPVGLAGFENESPIHANQKT